MCAQAVSLSGIFGEVQFVSRAEAQGEIELELDHSCLPAMPWSLGKLGDNDIRVSFQKD